MSIPKTKNWGVQELRAAGIVPWRDVTSCPGCGCMLFSFQFCEQRCIRGINCWIVATEMGYCGSHQHVTCTRCECSWLEESMRP